MALFDDIDPKAGTSLTTPTGSGLFDNLPEAPGPIASGFKTGVAGVKSAAGGLMSLAGRGLGVKGLETAGEKVTSEANQQAAMYSRRAEDVTSVGEAVDFAQYGIASALPSMLTMLAGAGTGRLVGGLAARKVTEDATRRLIHKVGMGGGAVGTTIGLEAGSIYPEAVQEGVESPVARSIVGGVAAGALDVVPEFYLARKLGLLGGAGRGVGDSRLMSAAKTGGKAALLEGATEGGQTAIGRVAAGQPLNDDDARSEFLNSVLIGMLAGGTFGGAAGALAPVQKTPENEQVAPDVSQNPENVDTSLLAVEQRIKETLAQIQPPPSKDLPAVNQQFLPDPDIVNPEAQLRQAFESGQAALGEPALPSLEGLDQQAVVPTQEQQILQRIQEAMAQMQSPQTGLPAINQEFAQPQGLPIINQDGTVESAIPVAALPSPDKVASSAEQLIRPSEVIQAREDTAPPVTAPANARVIPPQDSRGAITSELRRVLGQQEPAADASKNRPVPAEQQKLRTAFIDRSVKAVEEHTAELVSAGALSEKTAGTIQRKLGEALRNVFEGTTDPAQVRANLEEAVAKTVKGRINKGDAETFTDQLLAKIAGQPREFLSKAGVENKAASWTPKRTQSMIRTYGTSFNNNTKAYVTRIRPQDFLNLTADKQGQARIAEETKKLNPKKLAAEDQEIYLDVEETAPGVFSVIGHEGRHRMTALMKAGFADVPVTINTRSSTPKEVLAQARITRQRGGVGDADVASLIPLNQRFEQQINEAMQAADPTLQFSKAPVLQTPDQLASAGREMYLELQRLLGDSSDLEVRFFTQTDPNGFAGRYRASEVKDLIELATNAKDRLSVAGHEAFHRIETKHLSAQERAILRRGLKKGTPLYNRVIEAAQRYDAANQTNITSEIESVPQEARAYGFEMWRRGELEVEGTLQKVFAKIQRLLEKISNYISGLGFTSVEDIFRAADLGKYAKDGPNPMVARDATEAYKFVDEALESQGGVAQNKNENGDPATDEATFVEKNLSEKDPISAAKWMSENAPSEDQRLIAGRVHKQLSRLKAAGLKLEMKIAHVGDKVPAALLGARGVALSKFAPGESSMSVWLNGADVTGKVGVSYETVLHELVHAATMSAVRLGNMKKAAGTKLASDVADLYTVSNAIIRHFNQRVKGGMDSLTQFEKEMYSRANNAFVNPNETVAWALTNRDAQAYLETIQYQGKSLWTQFVEAVRTFLGLEAKSNTALSEVLRISETLLEAPVNELESIAAGVGQSLQIQAPLNQEFLSRGALASSFQEITEFAKSGKAEEEQIRGMWARAIDKLGGMPKTTTKDLLGAHTDAFAGGIERAYDTHFGSGMNLARKSVGFANTFKTITAYEQRKNRLIAEGVDVKLKTWQDRKTTNDNITNVSKALLNRTVDGAKVGTPEYQAILSSLSQSERVMFKEATDMIASQLDAEFVADQRSMQRALGEESDAYKEWFENRSLQVQRLKDEGYVPERRYGDHVVYATVPYVTPSGKMINLTVLREQFENQSEAQLRLKQYQEALGTAPDMQVQYGFKFSPEHDASLSYQQFLDLARRFDIDVSQAEKERLAKAMISADSVRRNRIFRRKNVAGYSEDGLRVLSEFAVTMANKIAYSEFSSAIADAQQGKVVTVTADQNRQPVISVDENTNLWQQDGPMAGFYRQRTDDTVDYVLQPQRGGEWSRFARMAASLHFLGGSLGAAVVQVSSLPMVSMPYLSQFAGGYTAAHSKVVSGFMTAVKNSDIRNIEKLQNPNVRIPGIDEITGLRQALSRAAEDGTTMDTEIYQIMGQSRGSMLSKSRNARRALEAWMYPFREAEKINRAATFIAAYRIGAENKLQGDKLYEFARDSVYNTQNRYDEANRSALARNPIWAILFTFKSFPIFMTETIYALHKQNPRAAVFMLLSLAMAAGVNGLPFSEDLQDIVDTIAQRLFNSPFNTQRAMKNVLKNASEAIVGTDLSGLFLHGVVNQMTGLSFASRVGLGNLIPGTRAFAADNDYKRTAQEVLGPVASQVIGGYEGLVSLSKGDFVKAVRQGAPLAVQNAVKGYEQWSSGYAQDVGGRKLVDVGGFEALMQSIGLSSSAVSSMYSLDRIDKQTVAFYQMVRTDFTNDIVAAVRENKPEKIEETLRAVNAWNESHPEMPIVLNPSNIRRTVAEAGLPLNQRTLLSLPKQLRGSSEAYELTRNQ